MSEERLWKFRKPEWMNSSVARSAGVYGAGALVSCFPLQRGEEVGLLDERGGGSVVLGSE